MKKNDPDHKRIYSMPEKQNIGLQDSDITNILETIQRNDKVRKIIVFGSRAKGTFHNGSDIDIALSGIELNINDIINLNVKLEALELPYKFDLVIMERIKDQALLDHISRVGVILYDKN